MDFFLDVNGHRRHFERTGILLVLALPDELWVERRVARVENFLGRLLVIGHEIAQFLGGDVGALVLVLGGEDGRGGFGFGGMANIFREKCPRVRLGSNSI